jgi:hypothetical protein
VTPKLERTLHEGVEALESLGIPYAVVGGLAVGTWSVPRATRDVDLYAAMPVSVRPSLRHALQARGFDVPAMEQELERFGVFRSRSRDGVFLDIFDSAGPLGAAIISRRRQAPLAGHTLWVVAPEDLALLKAFSDRPRDFDDLVTLLHRAKSIIDMPYVEKWAKVLDESLGTGEVSERVRRAGRSTRGGRSG